MLQLCLCYVCITLASRSVHSLYTSLLMDDQRSIMGHILVPVMYDYNLYKLA